VIWHRDRKAGFVLKILCTDLCLFQAANPSSWKTDCMAVRMVS
jgi:hypothetical protein